MHNIACFRPFSNFRILFFEFLFFRNCCPARANNVKLTKKNNLILVFIFPGCILSQNLRHSAAVCLREHRHLPKMLFYNAKGGIMTTKKNFHREETLDLMAKAYHDLLVEVGPLLQSNKYIESGLKEGLNKFLSNVWISCNGKERTDYISKDAEMIRKKEGQESHPKGLVYEHMVPKNEYIQKVCLSAAKEGKCLSIVQIRRLLQKYWVTATITEREHEKLRECGFARKMPEPWDETDVFARYAAAKISLIPFKSSGRD